MTVNEEDYKKNYGLENINNHLVDQKLDDKYNEDSEESFNNELLEE